MIHAGKPHDPAALPVIEAACGSCDDWPDVRGAVIGIARLTGCHPDRGCCRPWGNEGAWHWQLTNARPLPRPVPCPGRQRLWKPDTDLIRAICVTVLTR